MNEDVQGSGQPQKETGEDLPIEYTSLSNINLSIVNVIEWLRSNGITPIPCDNATKKPVKEISKNMVDGETTFHVPTPKRLEVLNIILDNVNTIYDERGGLNIAIDCNPAYNSGKFVTFVDIDKKELVDYFIQYFKGCPIVYGANGCKVIFFTEKQLKHDAYNIVDENKEHIGEIYSGAKRLCLIYGKHPNMKEDPTTNIKYKVIINNNTIPTITTEELTNNFVNNYIFNRGYDLEPISTKDETNQKVYVQPLKQMVKNSNARSLTEFVGLTITNSGTLSNFTDYDGILKGDNSTHSTSSKSNSVIHINTSKDTWFCHLHQTGGGALEWFAMNEGIIRCEDCNGRNVITGQVYQKVKDALVKKGYMNWSEYGQYMQRRR